jgi:hypothetical protein
MIKLPFHSTLCIFCSPSNVIIWYHIATHIYLLLYESSVAIPENLKTAVFWDMTPCIFVDRYCPICMNLLSPFWNGSSSVRVVLVFNRDKPPGSAPRNLVVYSVNKLVSVQVKCTVSMWYRSGIQLAWNELVYLTVRWKTFVETCMAEWCSYRESLSLTRCV